MAKHLTEVGFADYGRFLMDEPHWVWLTYRGVRLSGTGFRPSQPTPGAMVRIRAINEVRLHIARRAPEARWVSGRSVLREQGHQGRGSVRSSRSAVSATRSSSSTASLMSPSANAQSLRPISLAMTRSSTSPTPLPGSSHKASGRAPLAQAGHP